jgi:hypothetical protein
VISSHGSQQPLSCPMTYLMVLNMWYMVMVMMA